MKYLSLICMTFVMFFSIESYSQTAEEIEQMKAEKAEKEARAAELKSELDALTGEIKSIQSTLDGFVKWRFGSGGLLGADFNRFNNWAPKAELNSSASTITFGYSGFANYIDEKYFWRNTGNINLGWLRFDNDTQVDELGETNDFNEVSDIINAQSLFGYNLSPKLAASAAAEFRSSILSNFNNPGYLDLGAGITYTPLPNLVIVAHPLNYNFIFSEDENAYTSTMGSKFIVDYNTTLFERLTWRSNLSGFLSYQGNDFSNFTWINGINFNAFKGIGVGVEFGLRWNPQETTARELSGNNQSYYSIGLSYTL